MRWLSKPPHNAIKRREVTASASISWHWQAKMIKKKMKMKLAKTVSSLPLASGNFTR